MNGETSGQRWALVTGASRGLGATVARFLAAEGYHLVLTARGARDLEAAAKLPRSTGARIECVSGDVTDRHHRELLRDRIGEVGRLDLLVNNASELGPSPLRPLEQLREEDLERIFRVNVAAPLALIQLLLPYLEHARGRVVNISSDAANGAYPGWGGYGSSKAALDLISRTLAVELAGRGVSVVSVDPGDLRTAMHQAAFPGEDISDRPLPDVTIPFWAWLLNQDPATVSGRRFRAQADRWEVPA
jgi:NAD(P)-dependent dehydrogenase (short-subunit alcohol dehydrogenase family)